MVREVAALKCGLGWQWESSTGAIIPLFCAERSLPASGSHRYRMMVNERWLGEVRPFMTCTFLSMRRALCGGPFLNKAAALLFPGSQLVSMFMYVCMPLLAVTLCYQAARVLRRYRPDIWKTLNGDADKKQISLLKGRYLWKRK